MKTAPPTVRSKDQGAPSVAPWLTDRRAFGAIALLIVAYGLALALSKYPLELWDEARQAVNAAEMNRSGLSLVTTFGFRPDLWNTKPPLLVWLVVASFRLFGVSMLSLRLPSILASVATVAVVARFCWKTTHRGAVALLATTLLVASSLFFDPHIGMTADFDALLTLCLTVSSLAFFRAVHAPPGGSRRYWVIVGFAIGAAVLAKGIAGLLTLPGLLLYLVLVRRWTRVLRTPAFWGAVALALAMIVAFYLSRERVGPGYLTAVFGNEVGGRYGTAIEGHAGPPWFYLVTLARGGFSLGPLFLLAPFLLRGASSRLRTAGLFTTVVPLTMFLLYSAAKTKLYWYVAPTVPLIAILSALAAYRLVQQRHDASWSFGKPLVAFGALVLAFACGRTAVLLAGYDSASAMLGEARNGDSYGALFERLATLGAPRVYVVDRGYAPQYRFYAITRDTPARSTALVPRLDDVPRGGAPIVATCDTLLFSQLCRKGHVIEATPNYVIVRLDR